jgi:hypothetical protein
MKTIFGLLLLTLTAVSSHAANAPQIQISPSGTNSQVQWATCGCSGSAIYELLSSASPTGAWAHVSYLTNITTFTTPHTNQAAFYRLGWYEGNPLYNNWTFDFAYTPSYGPDTNCATATGTLNLSFYDGLVSGSYNFAQSSCATQPVQVPLGPQNICTFGELSYYDGSTYQIVLSCNYPSPQLVGSYYYATNSSGRCVPMLKGGLWVSGFAGFYQYGTFTAVGR